MWSYCIRVGPNSITDVLIRRGHTEKATRNRDRDQSDAAASPGPPRTARNHRELGGGAQGLFPEPLEGPQPSPHLAFGLLASKTVRESIPVVLSSQFVEVCYSSARKLIHLSKNM